ncbi:hypothetical protein L7F22_041979 [Adiantum nelumboides]|nr:hypothetical protein [Adiantum nelumboides]
MSLQDTSSLPPNSIIDERAKRTSIIEGCSQRRLSQLTERAVDEALKLNSASRRLVDVVDIQSCGESDEVGCGIKSSFAFKLFKSSTKLASPGPSLQNWALGRKVQNRLIGARIYSLLMRWRSDPTFEWKARVALAVPILQEALYRVANSTEEVHLSQQQLESYLEHVLLQFESGNGLFVLQGTELLYPPMHCPSQHANSSHQTPIPCGSNGDDAPQTDTVSDMQAGGINATSNLASTHDDNTSAKPDNGEGRNGTQMQVSGREVNMLLKKRAAAIETRSRRELDFAAQHTEENVANTYTQPPMEMFGKDYELNTNENTYHRNAVSPRLSPRKTLGDMINLNWGDTQAPWDPLIMASLSDVLIWNKNISTTIQETLPNRDKQFPSKELSLRFFPSTTEMLPVIETSMPPKHMLSAVTTATTSLPSLLTSKSSICISPSIKPHQSLSLTPPNSSPSSSLVVASSLSYITSASQISDPSPSSSPLTSLTLPISLDTAPSLPLSVSSSFLPPFPEVPDPSVPALVTLSSLPSPSDFTSMPDPILPSIPHPLISSSPFLSPSPSPSSLTSVQDSLISTSLLLSSIPLECETQVQASAAATTSRQETDPQAAGSSLLFTSSTPPMPSVCMTEAMDEVARERGAVRLPLSIFLAERDECKMKDLETWEEPTEQMDPLCCVCMVGLKGAAFIPCGHTFCRKCSRELWRGRGACPLCNRFIREILDVY